MILVLSQHLEVQLENKYYTTARWRAGQVGFSCISMSSLQLKKILPQTGALFALWLLSKSYLVTQA